MRRIAFRRPQAGTPSLLLLVLFLMALLPAAPARAAITIFVNRNAAGANNGTSWANAYTSLQVALTGAVSNTDIWVAAGTYTPGTLRSDTFTLKNTTAIYGGFAGTETLLSQRNIAANPTILSGDIGVPGDNSDNSYNVVTSISTDATAILDGFTITGGNANDTRPAFLNNQGGGLFTAAASSTFANLVFSDNTATDGGGGIANIGGSSTLTTITFTSNSSEFGGGMYNEGSSPILTNATFNGNSAGSGGGMANHGGSSPTVTNVTFSGNSAAIGGGMYNDGSSPTLTNVTFTDNSTTLYGGAMATFSTSPIVPTVSNSILAGNTNTSDIYSDCFGELISHGYNLIGNNHGCTFTPTTSDKVGTASNPIDPQLGALKDNGGPTETMAPLAGSPALDAIPNSVNGCGTTVTTDQRGIARPFGGGCEIGAYEANGVATRLEFAADPQGGQAGAPLATQPVVGAQDADGNGASFAGVVTLALKPGSGAPGATLGGTLTVAAINSRASFSDLTLNRGGTGFQLIASGAGLANAESDPFSVADGRVSSGGGTAITTESEPNNVIAQANPIVLDLSHSSAISGTISSSTDVDLFSFTTKPGATIAISLTNLPADYDLALLPDPRVTLALSDSIDLDQIADIGSPIPDIGSPIPDIGSPIPDIGAGVPSASEISARSTQRGTASETIETYLPRGGTYFALVYSHANAADATKPYQLKLTLRDGALASATTSAAPVAALNLAPDAAVKTIYLYNSQRLAQQYRDDLSAVRELTSTLQASSALLAADPAIGKGKGIAIDLSSAIPLGSATALGLTRLYSRWDNAPDQPLLANEVAKQIYNILDRAISDAYPNASDIVIVGGDSIIPFYRVPDETQYANEGQYGATLRGAGATRAGSALDGSLFRRFIQTDNFYGDRAPTPWRGRALFLPDLGVGRLVESPSEIMHYLNGYLASSKYTIDASGSSAAAMVSGYDFLKDQADAIAQQLGKYGFAQGESPKLSSLISDTWGLNDFTNMWFSGQLPQLGPAYSGAQTGYSLTSLNGHFTYNTAIPASYASGVFSATQLYTPTGVFSATQLYTPTALADDNAFFKINHAPTLIYTIGCHSGLNVNDSDVVKPSLRADFPQAVLKQGGNWIGNTGYGYGDYNVIGYSERLSLLFTHAIGRTANGNSNNYIGAPIGDALARAKRQYLKTSGGNSFSVYDEKVLEELTLYGLPFLRVKVPNPTPPNQDEPPPAPIPTAIRATLADGAGNGIFTRVVTMTNTFSPLDSSGLVSVTSTLEDSFGATTTIISSQQTAIGKPVLPLLDYGITLQKNPDPIKSGGADGIPIPRGVRLRSATMLPELSGFDPRVTSTITDRIGLRPQLDPQLAARGAWLPTLPYTTQRTNEVDATQVITSDRLLVFPAQFNPFNSTVGRLRRYTQMVFEITYVDPRSAPAAIRDANDPPVFDDAAMTLIAPPAGHTTQAADQLSLRLSAAVSAPGGLQSVSATYTTDGQSWRRQPLVLNQTTGTYEASFSVTGGNFYALLEAIDSAGNVEVTSNKGTQFALSRVLLPAGRR